MDEKTTIRSLFAVCLFCLSLEGADTPERPVSALVPANAYPVLVRFSDLALRQGGKLDRAALESPPQRLRELDGKRIRIRGFMCPTFDATGVEKFPLMSGLQLTDFGRQIHVDEVISVELAAGKDCDYVHAKPIDVVGTFQIELIVDDDKPVALYWITDGEVIVTKADDK